MYRSIILPLAKKDIKEAAKWYNERQSGLGRRFAQHIRQKVRFICQNPEATAVRYGDVRTAVLDFFPYMIHFTVDDDSRMIIISAVLSTHQNPDAWKKRQ